MSENYFGGNYFNVAVDAPLPNLLTYKSVDVSNSPVVGSPVTVPLGKRSARGVVIAATTPQKTKFEIKEITKVHTEWPSIPPQYVEWMSWISNYYQHPIGQVAQLFFPPLDKKEGRSKKSDVTPKIETISKSPLTKEQVIAVNDISSKSGFSTHLIFGVTGSGKTEVYLELFEKIIAENKQGLFLVPEISLTPQLIRRFSERFGDQIAVLHSHLTDREKTNQWWSIVEGKKKILIGARSALFCPFQNLGLIVVDEEHETSFKQDEKLKYHARDAAIVLAQTLKIPICLGSATPSLESWKNAIEKKYYLHTLQNRYKDLELPDVRVVDLRDENAKRDDLPKWMSIELFKCAKACLENGQQVAFFLNRRGMARTVLCPSCGHSKMCPNCEITLSLHGKNHLVCHYCDFHETLKEMCEHCKLSEYISIGVGTEKVEEDLATVFPHSKVIRLDRDEIFDRDSLTNAISAIEKKEVDIIVGTQMIAKGLDFKHLSLVGIVLADIGFNIPDFRTGERMFQLLTQVSGRPGRHNLKGQVIIQTYNPEYPSLGFAKKHDYLSFANHEMAERKDLHYPPFGRMACIRIQGLQLDRVKKAAVQLKSILRKEILKHPDNLPGVQLLGPAPAALSKLKNKYRYNMLVKSASSSAIRNMCREVNRHQNDFTGVKISLDIDPIQTL